MPGVLKAHIPAKSPLIPYLRAAPSAAAAAAAATGSAAAGEGGPWGGRRTLLFFHGALCWKIYDKVDGMAAPVDEGAWAVGLLGGACVLGSRSAEMSTATERPIVGVQTGGRGDARPEASRSAIP